MMDLAREVSSDFPMLASLVRGKRLVYLDNAATALKPRSVVEAMSRCYERENANIHRGSHFYATAGTEKFELARETVAKFLNAKTSSEIIFTRGTTNGINLIANSVGELLLNPGDTILLTEMEHHSNIVPWQLIAKRKGARIELAPIDDSGQIDQAKFSELLKQRPRIVAFSACSNALGTVNPVAEMCAQAKSAGAIVIVDAAQAVAHAPVDVQRWGCDAMAFSAHKVFGPFGIGAVYVRESLMSHLPPYEGGGGMISEVSTQMSTWADVPHKFEAGTPNFPGVIGMAEAIRYVQQIGWEAIRKHEAETVSIVFDQLRKIPDLKLFGSAPERAAIFSFQIGKMHHSDVGELLDQEGIAIRAGHHCCQPLMKRLQISGTARASFSIYNTVADIESLVSGIKKVKDFA